MKTEIDNHLNAYLLPKTLFVKTTETKDSDNNSILKKILSERSNGSAIKPRPKLIKRTHK